MTDGGSSHSSETRGFSSSLPHCIVQWSVKRAKVSQSSPDIIRAVNRRECASGQPAGRTSSCISCSWPSVPVGEGQGYDAAI